MLKQKLVKLLKNAKTWIIIALGFIAYAMMGTVQGIKRKRAINKTLKAQRKLNKIRRDEALSADRRDRENRLTKEIQDAREEISRNASSTDLGSYLKGRAGQRHD